MFTSSILQNIKIRNSDLWNCSSFNYAPMGDKYDDHPNNSGSPNYGNPVITPGIKPEMKPEIKQIPILVDTAAESSPVATGSYGYLYNMPYYTKTAAYGFANTGVSVAKYVWKSPIVEDGKKFSGSVYNDITKLNPGTETFETGAAIVKDWGGGKAVGGTVGAIVGATFIPILGAKYGAMVGAIIGGSVESGRGLEHAVDEILPKKKNEKNDQKSKL